MTSAGELDLGRSRPLNFIQSEAPTKLSTKNRSWNKVDAPLSVFPVEGVPLHRGVSDPPSCATNCLVHGLGHAVTVTRWGAFAQLDIP